jgi:hypothetical protein
MDTDSKEDAQYRSLKDTDEPENQIQKDQIPPTSFPLLEHKDEDLSTLHKIHAILLNCINLDEKVKLEFCTSQRYFMKLYLKKLREKLKKGPKESSLQINLKIND